MNRTLSKNVVVNVQVKRPKKANWKIGRLLFILPVVLYLLAIFVYPIYRTIVMGFENYSITSIGTGEAPFVGLDNYINLFKMGLTWKVLENTLLFVVGSIVFQITIGMLLALFFSKKFPLNGLLRSLLLIPWLLPLIVSGTAFQWIFNQSHGVLNWFLMNLHIIDKPIAWLVSPHTALLSTIITNIWVGIPFSMVLFYSGLQDIPPELYEAAAIDGCNAWKKFWFITVPSMRAVIAVVLMLSLIYTLKVFDIIMIMTGGGPANASDILSTWSYNLSFQQLLFGQGSAVANIMILISLIFAFFYIKITKNL